MCSYLPKVSPDFKLGKALHREGGYPPQTPPPSWSLRFARSPTLLQKSHSFPSSWVGRSARMNELKQAHVKFCLFTFKWSNI